MVHLHNSYSVLNCLGHNTLFSILCTPVWPFKQSPVTSWYMHMEAGTCLLEPSLLSVDPFPGQLISLNFPVWVT